MFEPCRYIQWLLRFHGQARFDLATSGIPTVASPSPSGEPVAPADAAAEWARLREKIAAYNAVSPLEVVPALGTTHALWLSCAAVLSPGDEVLVEAPAYEPLIRIAEGAGARVTRFHRDAGARFVIDAGRIAAASTPRTRMIIVSNLHNPTGLRATDDELRAAARVADQSGALLLVDEVYAPFDGLIGEDGVFRGSARRLASNIVSVSSLTKCFGLGPERIGWLLGPPKVIARASDALVASAGALPASHTRVALAAFAGLPALAARARGLLAGKREHVVKWLAARGLSWSAPAEGLFGLVTVPNRGDLTDAIERAVRDHEVLVAPGAFFGVPSAFRVAWALPADRLDEGLARLAEALDV